MWIVPGIWLNPSPSSEEKGQILRSFLQILLLSSNSFNEIAVTHIYVLNINMNCTAFLRTFGVLQCLLIFAFVPSIFIHSKRQILVNLPFQTSQTYQAIRPMIWSERSFIYFYKVL